MDPDATLGHMSRPHALLSLVPAVTVLALVAGGCSEVEDAARDTANGAACSVAEEAVDGVSGQVDRAIEEIGADPEAAERELSGLREVLDRAASGISGDAKQALSDAADALGRLADEAGEAASGVDVDTSAVDDAQDAFGDAVDGVRDFC